MPVNVILVLAMFCVFFSFVGWIASTAESKLARILGVSVVAFFGALLPAFFAWHFFF